MSQNGYELLAELRAQTLDMFLVPNELLPGTYHGKIKIIGETGCYRSLASVDRQFEKTRPKQIDGRKVSAKFKDGEIANATPERRAMLEHYRQQAAENHYHDSNDKGDNLGVGELTPPGGWDEDRLYMAELRLAAALIRAGVMEPFDDDLGFDQE